MESKLKAPRRNIPLVDVVHTTGVNEGAATDFILCFGIEGL